MMVVVDVAWYTSGLPLSSADNGRPLPKPQETTHAG